MVIDFVFEKGIQPWDFIEVKAGETTELMALYKTSPNIRRIRLDSPTGPVWFIKKNIWLSGGEEILFSIDGIFHNVFSADRLPFSFEICINPDMENKTICVFDKSAISSCAKSQNRWKIALLIQSIFLIFLLSFLMFVFMCVLKEQMVTIMCAGIIAHLTTVIVTIRKSKHILNLIRANTTPINPKKQ